MPLCSVSVSKKFILKVLKMIMELIFQSNYYGKIIKKEDLSIHYYFIIHIRFL